MASVITKKGHKCSVCGGKIPAGARAVSDAYQIERLYPVKGIMRFWRYRWKHLGCA